MHVVVVDKVGANIGSLLMSLQRLGLKPGHDYELARGAASLKLATHVILAGVGSAHRAMLELEAQDLVSSIPKLQVPVLGICVGMQILYESSTEQPSHLHQDTQDGHASEYAGRRPCLGILRGQVRRLTPPPHGAVIHNGWNKLEATAAPAHPLTTFASQYVYFIHQYAAEPHPDQDLLHVQYGTPIPALVKHQNFYGMQFHPEKSAQVGSQMLQEFLNLC